MKKFWIVNKINSNTAELMVYGYINGDDVCASDFVRELRTLEKEYKNINIRINSGGGSVFEGFTIFNALRASKSHIETFIDGVAASMGTVIAMAGHRVHMSRNARFMTHRASGLAIGNADDMRQNAELLESVEKSICSIYSAKTGKTPDECKTTYLTTQDRWLDADQALSEKLIDSIYDADPVSIPQNLHSEKEVWDHYSNQFLNVFNPSDENGNDNPNIMKQISLTPEMKTALGIGETADQTAIENAFKGLVQKAAKVDELQNQLTTANSAKEAAETALAEAQKATATGKVKSILDLAVTEKKVTAELRAKLEKQYEAKPDELKEIVDSLQAYTPITSQLNTGNATEDVAKMTWNELDKSGKLELVKAANPELYKQKFDEQFPK